MGKISQGILGGFSGKVGNVIGATWKGIDYMRIKPAHVKNPKTEKQESQRNKFTTVLNFLQPMTDFIQVGFKNYAIKMTQFNSAMSYNLLNAVTGSYPSYSIDYARALLSRGALKGALNPAVASAAVGNVAFTWDDNSVELNAEATDQAMLLVYNPVKDEAVFITEGAARDIGSQNLTVPDSYSGDIVHAYIAFMSVDGIEFPTVYM
jgi:hypothetical protein